MHFQLFIAVGQTRHSRFHIFIPHIHNCEWYISETLKGGFWAWSTQGWVGVSRCAWRHTLLRTTTTRHCQCSPTSERSPGHTSHKQMVTDTLVRQSGDVNVLCMDKSVCLTSSLPKMSTVQFLYNIQRAFPQIPEGHCSYYLKHRLRCPQYLLRHSRILPRVCYEQKGQWNKWSDKWVMLRVKKRAGQT